MNQVFSPDKKSICIKSLLKDENNNNPEICISLEKDGTAKAVAFFDIDETLAHLRPIYERAIPKVFPNEDPVKLFEIFYKGFKLGNSYREFDRMYQIYINKKSEWIDSERYRNERLLPFQKEIDGVGFEAHEVAAEYAQKYGVIAEKTTREIAENNPSVFKDASIAPIMTLAAYYKQLGIVMVGMTANAKVFIQELAKHIGLSHFFIDIATDETMEGGGKEIAIKKLIESLEIFGIPVPKERLIFVGDSIRGDIGSGVRFHELYKDYSGKGILVVKNKTELISVEHAVNEDPLLRHIADITDLHVFSVADVPKNPEGSPSLLSRDQDHFYHKL